MRNKPNIFEYEDYRAFLKDLYLHLKLVQKKFSLRYFSRIAGFKTHTFLKEVFEGKSNLSIDSIDRFATALKLTQQEKTFFQSLVLFNQSKTTEEKQIHGRDMIRFKGYRQVHPLSDSQLRYCTHWFYVVVREMVNLPEFKEDHEWIAANTVPPINPKQAEEAIRELLKLNLIARNENGRLVQTNAILASADELFSPLIAQFHREFMKRASESIDLISREDRDISSVTFRVSSQTAKRLKEKIQNFRRELMVEASQDASPEAIFQLNLQLFPVTKYSSKKDSPT